MLKMLEKSQITRKAPSPTEGEIPVTKPKDSMDESLDSDHAMIEHSSNSIVNMAISLDPLMAARALNKVEQALLD